MPLTALFALDRSTRMTYYRVKGDSVGHVCSSPHSAVNSITRLTATTPAMRPSRKSCRRSCSFDV